MKRILTIALIGIAMASALVFAQVPDRLERRVQQLEQASARMEKRLADLEAKNATGDRRGMMGGGMMGGGGMMEGGGMMGGGGTMGGGKPNEQWRSPESRR
jgi:hypothetical protein